MLVQMRVDAEVMQRNLLALGDRRIVGVRMELSPNGPKLVFDVDAPDAPSNATEMDPVYHAAADGQTVMIDPGWK